VYDQGGRLLKTISKGLIAVLAIHFAIILPFVSTVEIKETKAQTAGPVTAVTPVLNLRTNDDYNTVIIKASYGTDISPKEFMFDTPVELDVDKNFPAGEIPRYEGSLANNTDDIRIYKLNRPTLSCQSGRDLRLLFLISVKYQNDPEKKYRFSGIYYTHTTSESTTETYHKYSRVPSGAFRSGGLCGSLYENYPDEASIIKLANETHINLPIVPYVTADQRQNTCSSIQNNWEQLKQDTRDMFIPAPGSVGQSQNENWIITGGMWNAAAWRSAKKESADAFCDWVEGAIGLPADQGQALIAIRQQKLAPSPTGIHRFNSIMERARQIGQDIDKILESSNPTCGDIDFKIFKWNKNLEGETYPDLGSFKTGISKLIEAAKFFFESYQEPVTSAGTEHVCGSNMGMLSGEIFQWLFCELANIIHGIAASIMTSATGWLTDSIGVDINMKFKDPKNHDQPTEGGGAETSAPRTAASMNISGTVEFRTEAEYNRAKDDGGAITVKVKNNDAVSAIINVSSAISWGTWASTQGRVTCRFTTTDNIPTEWTSVKIYSEDSSGNLRFRFSINYPPAGNTFTAISSIE
jgi:hypothetical protein